MGKKMSLITEQLVRLSTQVWLMKSLEKGGTQPPFGSLESELMSGLSLQLPQQQHFIH